MRRKLTYIGEAVCEDCGTGYSGGDVCYCQTLSIYQSETSDSVILCSRCADESDDKSDLVTCPECQGNENYHSCNLEFEKIPCPTCNGTLYIEKEEEEED